MTTSSPEHAPHAVEGLIDQGLAVKLLAVFAATAVALAWLVTLLPHDPYIRFQQLRDTIQFRAQWVYERVELDPTPIDVAIIGNSRVGAGLSGPKLQTALRAATGAPVNVANLSFPQEGRNIHYVVAKRLLEKHPEVKTIVMSVIQTMPRTGHPAFRDLADAADVARAPILLNPGYATDLAALPYRQLSLFTQTLAPTTFGDTRQLSPGYAGAQMDTTRTFRLPDGHEVDQDTPEPLPKLEADAARVVAGGTRQLLPASAADYEFAVERHYTREIAAMAAKRGVKVIFILLPIYSDQRPVAEAGFYTRFGPIISPAFLADEPEMYADYGHLNTAGSTRATAWLAEQLVSLNATGANGASAK